VSARETLIQKLRNIRRSLFARASLDDDGRALSEVLAERDARIVALAASRAKDGDPIGATGSEQDTSGLSEDPRTPAPTPKPTGRLRRYLPFLAEQPEPAPRSDNPSAAPSSYTEVYCGNSARELLPDTEFPIGLSNEATRNWRRSLTESKVVKKPTVDIEINPTDVAAVNRAYASQVRVSK
jgi:hypothetical protein